MTVPHLTGTSTGLDVRDLDRLRRVVVGRVVGPADADFAEARLPWNRRIDQHPAAVVEATSVDDIVATVRFARDVGVPVTAQPVGHGATTAVDGTIVLRTTALTDHHVDVPGRVARVDAGTRWQQLNTSLAGTGLAGLAGSSGDPSVVGYTLNGGMSWFGRAHGIAGDKVRAVDLVTPDAERVRVTRDSDPELFWALRGAGGDFGIATSLEFDLFSAPEIYGGRIIWSIENVADILRTFRSLAGDVPEAFTMWAWLLNLPDAEAVPEPLRGRWTMAVDSTYLGPADEAERFLDVPRDVAAPLHAEVGPVSVADLSAIAAEPTDPTPIASEAALLTGLPDDAIGRLLDTVGPGEPSLLTIVEIRQLGGAFARVPADAGAAGPVAEPFLLVTGGVVPSPELEPDVLTAVAGVRAALADVDSGRVPPTFAEGDPSPERAYPPQTLRRLRDLKAERDPDGVIRGNRLL